MPNPSRASQPVESSVARRRIGERRDSESSRYPVIASTDRDHSRSRVARIFRGSRVLRTWRGTGWQKRKKRRSERTEEESSLFLTKFVFFSFLFFLRYRPCALRNISLKDEGKLKRPEEWGSQKGKEEERRAGRRRLKPCNREEGNRREASIQ